MNLQIFVCFHKKIIHELYQIRVDETEKYLTFYGVKDRDSNIDSKVIYEYELPVFNPVLQKNLYNEGSCIYHVYKNELYKPFDYIGFCQYDMVFSNNIFQNIETKLVTNKFTNTIFYFDFFKWAFIGGQTTIIKDYPHIPSGLNNYNKFFGTSFTTDILIANKMIICNTFVVPKPMFQKLMSWLIQYFNDEINKHHVCEDGFISFNPGHMIEALTSMFFALEISEGAVYEKMDIIHDQSFKL